MPSHSLLARDRRSEKSALARDAASGLLSIRFIDASACSEAELAPELQLSEPVVDSKYGALNAAFPGKMSGQRSVRVSEGSS